MARVITIYTDASLRAAKMGVGIVASRRQPVAGRVLDPPVRDVNYAEMMAILCAIRHPPGPLTLYTDSACSLRSIANPCTANGKFKHIAARIHEEVQAAPHPIRFRKVKAHSGVPGNVWADKCARLGAVSRDYDGIVCVDDGRYEVHVGWLLPLLLQQQ